MGVIVTGKPCVYTYLNDCGILSSNAMPAHHGWSFALRDGVLHVHLQTAQAGTGPLLHVLCAVQALDTA
jgi:hypothetical protein